MSLQWKPSGGGNLYAWQGGLLVGMVVTGALDSVVIWQITGVHTRHVCKGDGSASDIPKAKRALAYAWHRWLQHAGLRPE